MKILHTSDWHIGKRLGRHDRMGEFAEVLAEVEAIADERAVDLVLVSGDIWDRPMPPTMKCAIRIGTASSPARPTRASLYARVMPATFSA